MLWNVDEFNPVSFWLQRCPEGAEDPLRAAGAPADLCLGGGGAARVPAAATAQRAGGQLPPGH